MIALLTLVSIISGYLIGIICLLLLAASNNLAMRVLGTKHWKGLQRWSYAVFALPFFQLYSAMNLIDTHIAVALAHCLFNVPLAVWILEGFMRGVPKEIDETA